MKNSNRRFPKMGQSWAKLTPEQKAERVKRMNESRAANKEIWRNDRLVREGKTAREKYQAFMADSKWPGSLRMSARQKRDVILFLLETVCKMPAASDLAIGLLRVEMFLKKTQWEPVLDDFSIYCRDN